MQNLKRDSEPLNNSMRMVGNAKKRKIQVPRWPPTANFVTNLSEDKHSSLLCVSSAFLLLYPAQGTQLSGHRGMWEEHHLTTRWRAVLAQATLHWVRRLGIKYSRLAPSFQSSSQMIDSCSWSQLKLMEQEDTCCHGPYQILGTVMIRRRDRKVTCYTPDSQKAITNSLVLIHSTLKPCYRWIITHFKKCISRPLNK